MEPESTSVPASSSTFTSGGMENTPGPGGTQAGVSQPQPERTRRIVGMSVLCSIFILASGYVAVLHTVATVLAHFLLVRTLPLALDPTGAFSSASLKATLGFSLVGTSLVLLPDLFCTLYVILQASQGDEPPSVCIRRAMTNCPCGAALYQSRVMRQICLAFGAPVGSLIYRAMWCSPEGCDALDTLHAFVASAVGSTLLGGYRLARGHFAADVSEELESLRREQLGVEERLIGHNVGTKDQASNAHSIV